MKAFYLILACCLILTACSSKKRSDDHSTMVMDANKNQLWMLNQQLTGNRAYSKCYDRHDISPEHYGMAREMGEGHIHMYLDNGEKIGVKEGTKYLRICLRHHILKISLHNNDHTPYDVTKTIEFDIIRIFE